MIHVPFVFSHFPHVQIGCFAIATIPAWSRIMQMSFKHLRPIIFIVGASVPAWASAQITTCNTVGATTTCNSNTGNQQALQNLVDSTGRGGDIYAQAQANGIRQKQLRQQIEASRGLAADADRRRAVGAMVANGQCDMAKRAALQMGDFNLAEQAARICVPAR